jgi:GMP synthase-like glutamine amidotransferase
MGWVRPDGQKQAVGTALILAGACFGGQFVVSRAGGSVFCTSQRSKSEIPVHMTIDSKSLTLTKGVSKTAVSFTARTASRSKTASVKSVSTRTESRGFTVR